MDSNAEEAVRQQATISEGEVKDPPRDEVYEERRRMSFARNGLPLLALFVLLSLGTCRVLKLRAKTSIVVVKLENTLESTPQSAPATIHYPDGETSINALDSEESRQRRQRKGMRKRAHRKIKTPHPNLARGEIIRGNSKRRLQMGMGGMSGMGGMGGGGGGGGFGGGRSGGSFDFFRRTFMPTPSPSASPSAAPVGEPSASPSARPSASPSAKPSASPSAAPTISKAPSARPSASPSVSPSVSFKPSRSKEPSLSPSVSARPSTVPSASPSAKPTVSPRPSSSPSRFPSASPSRAPSRRPSQEPTFVFRTFPPTIAPTRSRGTDFPTFDRSRSRSRSRSGMGGGGMGGGRARGRAFTRTIDQDEFNSQLQDLIAFLPPDFLALFGNN